MKKFAGRVGVIQRVLPSYRAAFFDGLAGQSAGGLSIFAGQGRASESIKSAETLQVAQRAAARNLHLFGGSAYLCWQFGLKTWLDEWNPDALIIEANPRYLSSRTAIHWMQQRDRPVIAWGLGAGPIEGSLAVFRDARRKAFLRSFDAIISYSQRGADEYRGLGFADKEIYVAPNAVVDVPKIPLKRPAKSGKGPRTVLFVGRLQERKGLDRLLYACAKLPEELQPNCAIVGEGPDRNRLEALAKKLYPKAAFLGGRYGSELDAIYAKADLFVLPGTGGLAIQQAMAKGLPVIVAEGDGTQEDLVDSKNGWLLSSKSVDELATVIEEALGDLKKLRAKGKASFSRVKERYNLHTMVDVFVEALNKVSS